MDIRNKVALITGSSRGVGRSVAQQLAARGCRVVINHRDSEDQAQETLGWIESHGAQGTGSVRSGSQGAPRSD